MRVPEALHLKLIVTIVDRGKGGRAVDIYRQERLHFEYLCMGMGTASSQILDYFGLAEVEKDVVLTLVPKFKVPSVIAKTNEALNLKKPGRGILFTIPLSGASSHLPKVLCKEDGSLPSTESEETKMEDAIRYDLILVIVNRGSVDTVMDAARAEGARGGTVLHARRVGFEDAENLLGFALQPEKDVVTILTPRAQKQAIMMAINGKAGLATEARGILFSLPVDDMIGLQTPVSPSLTEDPGASGS